MCALLIYNLRLTCSVTVCLLMYISQIQLNYNLYLTIKQYFKANERMKDWDKSENSLMVGVLERDIRWIFWRQRVVGALAVYYNHDNPLNKYNKKTFHLQRMTINNQLTIDITLIAEYYINYYVNVGPSLVEKPTKRIIDPVTYTKHRKLHHFIYLTCWSRKYNYRSNSFNSWMRLLNSVCCYIHIHHTFLSPLSHIWSIYQYL